MTDGARTEVVGDNSISSPRMPNPNAYCDDLYARRFSQRVCRATELVWRYYAWDLPRYVAQRRSLGLRWLDWQAAINPVREFFDRKQRERFAPNGYDEAVRRLYAAGVRLSLPPSRATALLGCWQNACATAGDVIECGSYRGATALLIAVLGKIQARHQTVFMLDTFSGSPALSMFDSLRHGGEYAPPVGHLDRLRHQVETLGVTDRVEICAGTFADTFRVLANRSLCFSFAHIDANLYRSTWEACRFVMPRMASRGAVVFDDYHGPCDLGARLAIDQYFSATSARPQRLAGSSASVIVHSELLAALTKAR